MVGSCVLHRWRAGVVLTPDSPVHATAKLIVTEVLLNNSFAVSLCSQNASALMALQMSS